MDPMIESKLGHLTFNHDFFAFDDDDDDNGGDDAEDNILIYKCDGDDDENIKQVVGNCRTFYIHENTWFPPDTLERGI